jgi:UrcA family protein
MDTKMTSPTRTSSNALNIALTVGVGLWLSVFAVDMATAQTPAAGATAKVSYSDLDLSTKAGAQTLLTRIEVAANSACGTINHSPLFPREASEHRKCVDDAVGRAVGGIDAPLVASLAKSRQAVLASR